MNARLAWILLVAGVLAGCGSYSGASSTGNGGRLTKAEWLSAADDICARAKADVADLSKPDTPAALVTQLDSLIRIFSQELKDLKTLTPVPEEQANAAKVVAAAGLQVTLAQGLQEVAKTGDTAAITAYTQANQPKVLEAQKVAGAYGLKVCGNGR
jgi:hypothetical protein